ncbi:glucose-1-phosphate thymidylyltransferase [Dactylosporangium sp. NPDC049525]|uniref:glucose-1-phosphate thymidylyltransferase n=1 Tax=Dactylosporangium sp. NPDC049525 TaxID=3154730 RepID=UPI003424E5EC
MKALVLSGGTGTRMRPLSYSIPKQLVPVGGEPVLAHVLARIRDLGVRDVAIVVGEHGRQIRQAIGDGSAWHMQVTYFQQDRPRGLGHAVQVARGFLGDDDFVMYLGDNVLTGDLTSIAAAFQRTGAAAHLVVRQVVDPRPFGVADVAADGRVRGLVEKPLVPASDLAVVGVYFLTRAVHEAIEAIPSSSRGELELTDALQWLVDSGADVRASELQGYWQDIGHIADLLACNRYLLGRQRGQASGYVDPSSTVDPQAIIAAGAKVLRSHVYGATFIGPNTVVEDSTIGPYTTIGAGCLVRSARIDGSIVMDDVRIVDPGHLDGAVIGRRAFIGRADQGSAHRLIVGADARVEIA